MKEIILKQYVEVRRVVALRVDDDCTEQEAAEMLDEMSLDNEKLGENVRLIDDWTYIDSRGIENENGKTVIGEEEDCGNG